MAINSKTLAATAIALSLGLGLAACGDRPNNRTLYSVKQPVVERNNFTFDLVSNGGGLDIREQQRLSDWFEAMDLRYGDRVAIDGATAGEQVSADVAEIAARHGLLLSNGAPLTQGFVEPGMVRVVVTRSRAHVPGCPDWSDKYASNMENSTSDDYGCSVNSNMAAMIADPEHLLRGAAGTGETVVMSSTKAIEAYRSKAPTGASGLTAAATGGN